MPQPIPSYLIALAVGDLDFQAISKRTGVWAEPSMLKKAAAEFEDTEKMVQAAEQLYGAVSVGTNMMSWFFLRAFRSAVWRIHGSHSPLRRSSPAIRAWWV